MSKTKCLDAYHSLEDQALLGGKRGFCLPKVNVKQIMNSSEVCESNRIDWKEDEGARYIREGKKSEYWGNNMKIRVWCVWKYMEEYNLYNILWSIIQKVISVEKNFREETRIGILIVSCTKKFYRELECSLVVFGWKILDLNLDFK